jgi:hypothetical protein
VPGETDVVNVGLTLVGAAPITSLTDGSTAANAADDIYTEVRDDLLRSHPWNFATKRTTLAKSATTPDFEFDYAYPLPSDWIRNISVHDNDAGHGTILFRVEIVNNQRCIITSSDAVYLRYVYRLTDPNVMSSDFRRALEVSLARDLAVKLASSNVLQDRLSIQADRALARARSSDALGAFPELRPRGSWASQRGGRRRNDFLSD